MTGLPASASGMVLNAFNAPLKLESAPIPEPEPGAIIAQIDLAGICGTDVHLHHGNLPIPTPVILGHEAVGRVAKLGPGVSTDFNGNPLQEGDAIAWASSIPCGHCYWCVVEGERTLCETRRIYGINQRFDSGPRLSGGWAEYIYLQPGSAIFKFAAGHYPAAGDCARLCWAHRHSRRRRDRRHQTSVKTVVVQGSGPVGLAAAMYAQLAGAAKTIIVGGPASRLQLAKEIGVGDVHIDIFSVTDPDERKRLVLAETPAGRGADVVLECAGVPSAVPEGFEFARRNGRYLVLGQYTDRGDTPINPHVITRKQLKVYGSWAFAEPQYAKYVNTLPQLAARFDLERLITTYPLAEANQALADMAQGEVMKAVLAP